MLKVIYKNVYSAGEFYSTPRKFLVYAPVAVLLATFASSLFTEKAFVESMPVASLGVAVFIVPSVILFKLTVPKGK